MCNLWISKEHIKYEGVSNLGPPSALFDYTLRKEEDFFCLHRIRIKLRGEKRCRFRCIQIHTVWGCTYKSCRWCVYQRKTLLVSVNMRYVLCRPKLEVITSQSLCIFVAVFRPIAPGRLVASFCLLFSSVRRKEEGPSSSFFSLFPFSAEGLSKGGRKGGRRTQGPERHSTHYQC